MSRSGRSALPLLPRLARGVLERVNAAVGGLYRAGVLAVRHAEVPVISVGNIALGGTGKTPLVAALARELLAAGQRPVVLTRGFRRAGTGTVIVPPGSEPAWELVGDEPATLARAVPGLALVVDTERSRGAERAVAELDARVLLLDDGFQHWRLARDLDVVVVDAGDPLSETALRRERPAALARAGALVVHHAEDPAARRAAFGALRRWCPAAPLLATALRPVALRCGGEAQPVATLRGRRVVAFAGIGRPQRFAETLAAQGAVIVSFTPLPDHHVCSRAELEELLAAARARDALLVTTAKDAVKTPAELAGELAWLEVEMIAIEGSFAALLEPLLSGPAGGTVRRGAVESPP